MNPRIGDERDDYCPRCRLLTNHTVAALVGVEVAQTACRTCGQVHPNRDGQVPVRKAKVAASAFDQVLAGILGGLPPAPEPKTKAKVRGRAKPKKKTS